MRSEDWKSHMINVMKHNATSGIIFYDHAALGHTSEPLLNYAQPFSC